MTDEQDESAGESVGTVPDAPPLALPVGLHLDVSHDAYHRDPADGISLSSSIACKVLRSPRHAWRAHVKLGNREPPPSTKAMDAGSLVHLMLLGRGPDLRIVEANDWRTKKAQNERDEARAVGQLPVLAKVYEQTTASVVEIHTELRRRGIDLTRGAPEATLIWNEDGVLCRARADVWDEEAATIYDVKFLGSAEPTVDVPRHMMSYGVDVQADHYVAGFETVFPALAGRVKFELVVIEQETGEITIGGPAGSMRNLGAWKRARAMAIWRECLATDTWRGYNNDERASFEAPEYATKDILKGGSEGVTF